jgi:hypothetical protein
MNFIACDGPVTVSNNLPECASGWLVVPESVVVQSEPVALTAADYEAVYGWVVLLMVTAIGIRYVIKTLNSQGGRNA